MKYLILILILVLHLNARPGDGGTEKLTVEGDKLSNDINTKNHQIRAKENSRVEMGISARAKDIKINTMRVSDTKCKKYIFLEECNKVKLDIQ